MNLRRLALLSALLAGLLFGAAHGPAVPVLAQSAASFTVAVKSAYLRAAPDAGAPVTYSVFQGGVYAITGRTDDSAWVSLQMSGATQGTWIRASLGVIDGRLGAVPVAAAGAAPGAPWPTGHPPTTAATPAAARVPVATPAPAGGAVSSLRFTITARSTFVRAAPSWDAERVASHFAGQTLRVEARDSTGQWLRTTSGVWLWIGVGQLEGPLAALAVAGAQAAAPGAPPAALPPPAQPAVNTSDPASLSFLPVITPRMRAIYRQAASRGLDPNLFTVAGDCNSEGPVFLYLLANNDFNLSGHPYLHATARQFQRSYPRLSAATNGGFGTSAVLNPLWANPRLCRAGETPFDCELRVSRASIIFILLGTGDQHDWQGFEARYRILIEKALARGVLPVLTTKADELESQEGGAEVDYINNIIRRLAAEYEVPLMDMGSYTRGMENRGLVQAAVGNNFHLSWEAINVHLLGTLQTLYLLTR